DRVPGVRAERALSLLAPGRLSALRPRRHALPRSQPQALTRGGRPRRRSARADLEGVEEVGDLEGGGLGRVRAVDGVSLDGGREVLPDRPRSGLGTVAGPPEIAP